MPEEEGLVEESTYLDGEEHFSADEVKEGVHHHDSVLVKCRTVMIALLLKKKTDGESFFGRSLMVQYAPSFETVDDLREKM